MSTFSCSANSCALRSGRTLNPMMMAFEAEASSTSDSVMAPTPERRTFNRTLSFDKLGQQIGQHFHRSANVGFEDDVQFLGAGGLQLFRQTFQRDAGTLRQRGFARLLFAVLGTPRALSRSATTTNWSPAWGNPSIPRISTGVEGGADSS